MFGKPGPTQTDGKRLDISDDCDAIPNSEFRVLSFPAMAELHELSSGLREFLEKYRWRTIDPVPVASMKKPLSESRVALFSSAGFVVPGDEPFCGKVRGGDSSYRTIPAETDLQALEEHHDSESFSHDGVEADRNMGLPLDRLRELETNGVIGSVAPRHISVMGSITAPGRYLRKTLPETADVLAEDEVDVALMVPV